MTSSIPSTTLRIAAMLKEIKNLDKKLHNQLLIIILLIILLPLVILQIQQRQIFQQDAAKKAQDTNKSKNDAKQKHKDRRDKKKGGNAGSKPNVIIFLTDDQPDDTLKFMPGIRDKLGSQGVTFDNAFVTTGLCCPSRASILTGEYAHNHNVFTNRPPEGGVQAFTNSGKDKETLAVWLKQAGYQTALVGKYMNEYDKIAPYTPPGWDNFVVFDDDNGKYFDYALLDNKKREKYGKDEKDYSTDVLAKKAVNFINRAKQPFFLYFTPHAPHGVPRPAYRHEKKCDNAKLPKGPAYNENDVSDKPNWVKKLKKLSNKDIKEQEDEFSRKMCTLKAMDDAVADILKALGNKRDNTLIIFMSDNGYSFGDHRWTQKDCSYDVCVGVDMIISYPKLTNGKKSSSQFALNIDIAPTILDIAGITIPKSVDGKSLKPLLENPDTVVHESFLIETYNNENNPKGVDYAIRTKNYMYNELFSGERELYDLGKDPHELVNVAKNHQYGAVIKQLSADIKAMKENKSPPSQSNPTPTQSQAITPTSLTPTVAPTVSGDITPTSGPIAPTGASSESAELKLAIVLDGIGSGGDLVNINDSSLSNKNPDTVSKDIIIEFWDGTKRVAAGPGIVHYNSSTGKYMGSVFIGKSLMNKEYTVKVKGINYLVKKFPDTVSLQPGDTLTLPDLHLVTGDINNDNTLSILDYNLLLNCFGEGEIPDSCYDEYGIKGDLDDDAYVLEVDYNLFIREFSQIQKGD